MKKIRLILVSAVLVCTLGALTSCTGNNNAGMTDGTDKTGMVGTGVISEAMSDVASAADSIIK